MLNKPEPINIISEAKYSALKDFQIWRIGVARLHAVAVGLSDDSRAQQVQTVKPQGFVPSGRLSLSR
ncbi:hypothetical protein Pfra02_16220 [Pseudomonas fragi]|nr:hypothetical protein Pfra02_16220 [Pseudomonas fragi]